MRVFETTERAGAELGRRTAVTIGKFDGVHTGHRAVVARLRALADERDLATVVVTFDRNPLSLLAPDKCPDALLSNPQKLERLARTGVDATVMLAFDRELSQVPAEEFVSRMLVHELHAGLVLIGADFRFGARGAGSAELLQRMAPELGFEVVVLDEVLEQGRRASSTWVRELLAEGRVGEAAQLLGEPPAVRSTVARGEQRGRQLGYPTANLDPAAIEGFIPADGVYAAWMTVDGRRYPAAVSIGNNPTFEGVPAQQVEAHALDADLDIYGRPIEVEFVDRVRGMRRFDGVEPLIAQMRDDEARVRRILSQP
ncbi:MAG TPA: bifunctional riboflavin kinase/FAD synthetase [Rhodoglobus sp.]|nr:bifunctional riboflavin kinase/FAD synthetase [Rhodoglobus sp.]